MTNPILSSITTRLAPTSDSPALDASVLIAHVIKKPRTWVMAHPELTLTTQQQEQLEGSLARLERGESFPYVLGRWEFYGLEFEVTPDVLIPRPETELLVEKAIAWLNNNPNRRSIADIGTGSGAIAISIAHHKKDANVLATDISSKALTIAKRNAKSHQVDKRIQLIECDLLPTPLQTINKNSKFDLLCANLPYIPTATLHGLSVYGREPTLALDGGASGFALIKRLMQIISEHLSSNAVMFFEIEETLGKQAIELAHHHFPKANIQLHKDLMGHDRLLEIHQP